MALAAVLATMLGQLAVALLAIGLAGRGAWAGSVLYAASAAAGAIATLAALASLLAAPAPPETLILPFGLPWLGAHLRLDALAAFFLAVVNFGGAIAALYGIGYGAHEPSPRRVLPFFAAFLAAMNLVVLADDAFTFLLAWECMSLLSWALVMAHHHSAANRAAGHVYLTMAGFGTLALLLAFGLLAGPAGDYGFAAIRSAPLTPWLGGGALLLAVLGTGSKAGLVPLHVWLPLAHPAAPSHVSALMSGVMTKVALYGLIRILFDLLGPPPGWASMVLLAAGGATAVLGVLQALMQSELKRLLAYSTIENIGVICVGLGLAIAFQANGMTAASALAMTAALCHIANHALFKSLLFLGAGAVLTATGERDLERLGGLIHRMPQTSFLFLIGAVAIAALPPLNGFVSEWLTFQAVLLSPVLPHWGLKIMVPAVGGLLALATALAAACFVKAFGIAFLGRARSAAAATAQEVEPTRLVAMALLALACLLIGLLPGYVIDGLAPVTRDLLGAVMPAQPAAPWQPIVPVVASRSSYSGLLVFLFIGVSASLAALVIHRVASHAVRRAPAWDCGYPEPSPLAQYSAGSFAQPLRRVFGTSIFRAREQVTMPLPGDLRPARFALQMRDLVWEGLYLPLAAAIGYAAERLNALQFLTIRRYLGMVFLALVTLLLVLALWPSF